MTLSTENYAKCINTLCGQNAESLKGKAGYTCGLHWVFTFYVIIVLCDLIKYTYLCGVTVTTPAQNTGDALFEFQSTFGVSLIYASSC
jgi:hypothetical protein